MAKTILLTGATDGIGLETAKLLAKDGHALLLHGRNSDKLRKTKDTLAAIPGAGSLESIVADMSDLDAVRALAVEVAQRFPKIDVLINNAGVFKAADPITAAGLDVRFVVNTVAPYLLTRELFPVLGPGARVINVSSAAQAQVNPKALTGKLRLADMEAYAQSKLAIMLWTLAMAEDHPDGPVFLSVNPGSLLASKMVKDGFGIAGNDLGIGAEILTRAALSEEFAGVSGRYFDNDSGQLKSLTESGTAQQKAREIVQLMEEMLSNV